MSEAVSGLPQRFHRLGKYQDMIGWRRLPEGMVSKEMATLQQMYLAVSGSRLSIKKWTSGLIMRLLEITHGQWIYRNFLVHDNMTGTLTTARKEDLQAETEKQQQVGDEGLLSKDEFLAEVNLEDLSTTSGGKQQYWLLAIKAARKVLKIRRARDTNSSAADTT